MKRWWMSLAGREQKLIQLAIGLSILVLGWQFLLMPALDSRADARSELVQTDRQLARLQEAYALKRARGNIQVAPGAGEVMSGDAFKTAVTQSATEKGLSISRLQMPEGQLALIFETADPRFAFYWLDDVETRLGGQIDRLVMEHGGNGQVRFSVDLRPISEGPKR